jgi:alpha-glucosidase
MSKITQAINSIRFVGINSTLRTVLYAYHRDQIDKFSQKQPKPAVVLVGKRQSLQRTNNSLRIRFGDRTLEISFLTVNMVRLTWLPGELPVPYAIAQQDWPTVDYTVEEIDLELMVRTGKISLVISSTGAVKFMNKVGHIIRQEQPPQFLDSGWNHTTIFHPQEIVYGLGLRAAPINLRGRKYRMWNTDPGGTYNPGDDPLYVCLPVYLGVKPGANSLIFYENSYPAVFDFREEATVIFDGGALRYYFITGELPEIFKMYTELTGRPPLPPQWALGYHQSRWGYKDQAQVNELLDNFIENDLPLSALHLDIDYMRDYRVFTVDTERFPDLAGLSLRLASQNAHLVTILDPGVKCDPQYTVDRDGLAQGVFIKTASGTPVKGLVWPGWCHYPDFTSPAARNWWKSYYATLLNQGVSGFWHDMNEPALFSAWGEPTLPQSVLHHIEGKGGDHLVAHNIYGHLMNQAGFEGLSSLAPDKRPWILSRSGWVGTQRFAWHWTADANATWDMLKQTLISLLHLSMSGYYFSGSDIGGFSHHPTPELYIRWFQLAAFTPFFRLHNAKGLPPREPWTFGKSTLEIVRNIIRFRYRLMPYLYSLAYQSSSQGLPIIRPTMWADPHNLDTWEIDDQFLLGDNLLVAPVLNPGQTDRSILLPPGEWIDLWDGTRYNGPGPIMVPTPLDKIPVLVRAGSVIPLQSDKNLELAIYLPSDINYEQNQALPTSLCYQDAGDGFGDSRQDNFQLESSGDCWTLNHAWTGDFLCPNEQVFVRFVGNQVTVASCDGKILEDATAGCWLDRNFRTLRLN